jgi:hypothetical protein
MRSPLTTAAYPLRQVGVVYGAVWAALVRVAASAGENQAQHNGLDDSVAGLRSCGTHWSRA